ncbi:MAG: sel1 repeat family protein [Magnetococcus sp. MYC-9]
MSRTPSPERYLRLIQTLAEQGNPKAQHNLGAMLLQGQGMARDDAAAAHWLRKAAEQGIAPAQHNLGVMLLQGQGVGRDPVEAARWLLAAAWQGDPRSQHTLGALYHEGLGVEQSDEEAFFWLSLSGVNAPQELLPHSRAIQEQVASGLSTRERDRVQQRVAAWRPSLA